MSNDDENDRELSPKEYARRMRRQAYQQAKERRAKDPRLLALKEAAKQRRRDLYRQAKEREKSAAAGRKAEAQAEESRKRAEKRAASDEQLMKLVKFMSKGSDAEN